MTDAPKINFKTGTVPYKIEKQFYTIVDDYNSEKLKLNAIIKAKNEQILKKDPENSNFLANEPEIQSKLQQIEQEFSLYMTQYLKKYKEDPEDYNEISFPVKIAAQSTQLFALLAKIASDLNITHEQQGKKITVYKTKLAPRIETFKEEKKTVLDPKNPEKPEKTNEKLPNPTPIAEIRLPVSPRSDHHIQNQTRP